MDVVSCALERCPFLGQLAREHGEQFTRNIATNPFKPAGGRAPLLAEEVDFAHSFKLFHGPRGIVPLTDKPEARVEEIVAEESAPCTSAAARQGGPRPLPLASMSFGFFGTVRDPPTMTCICCIVLLACFCGINAPRASRAPVRTVYLHTKICASIISCPAVT